MYKILEGLVQSKEKCSIYNNKNDLSKFYYGNIIAVNEKEFAINRISPDGYDDGVSVMRIESVIKIELNSQYIKKMEKLYQNINLNENVEVGENILESLLKLSLDNRNIVSVELVDSGYSDVIGIVEKIEGDICRIKQIDDYGNCDGCSCIKTGDITFLTYMSDSERRLKRLIVQ